MKKVLVVEDDPSVRLVVAKIVEDMGYPALQASDGKIALQMIHDNPNIELIITDLVMPETDGTELIKILRGTEQYAKMPVILISGVVEKDEIDNILVLGTAHFIKKPIQFKKLNDLIHSILDT